ncbi:MAG TPA: acyltransferase [Pseudonocardiaceae bacterium]|nr:acyltransferase [Pseudonocardiaceae bacterium]
MRRSAGPDQFKAILLTLVIFGHTYTQLQTQDFGKWLIYGFHMPAFLFLSGFLLDADRLRARPIGEFLKHYWKRMLAGWLVVSVVYLLLFDRGAFDSAPHAVTALALTPAFHLWYVPVLFTAVLATRLAGHVRAGRIALIAVAVLGMAVFETPLNPMLVPSFVAGHLDHRYFGYYGWFLLGFAVRNGWLRMPARAWRLAAIVVGGAGWVAGYFGHEWAGDVGFIVLNIGVTLCVPAMVNRLATPLPWIGAGLVRIGRYSLWVYLLHPFITGSLQVSPARPVIEQRVAGLALTAAILVVSAAVTIPLARRRREPVAAGADAPAPAVDQVSS